MNFNKFLKSLFGDKSSRDMKLIQPLVEKIKAASPEIEQLDNDALRAKTKEIQQRIQSSAQEQKAQIAAIKETIENTPIDERAELFEQIDKLEKEILEIYEDKLNEAMPQVFAIVKETAKRFANNEETIVTASDFDRELAANPANDFITIDGEKAIYHNHWTAGGNDLKWEMVHYDVQLFGGCVLHQGKIAEMATGEGKTLVATLPVFLNALTGNGVHVVTVNDYLAKRDSEWMGPLYMDSAWIASTSTSQTQNNADALTRLTSHSVPTTNSASTTSATIWPQHRLTSCREHITMPSSMRWTQCSSTTLVLRSSSQDLYQRATTRCLRNTSHWWRNSSMYSANSPLRCSRKLNS